MSTLVAVAAMAFAEQNQPSRQRELLPPMWILSAWLETGSPDRPSVEESGEVGS
jgi:hypothetical protein